MEKEELEKKINNRMMRIGSGRKKNFMTATQESEIEANDKLVIYRDEDELGMNMVELVLEPNKMDKLGSECRLTFEEFLEVMNDIADEEEDDWDSLRTKDMINLVRDKILESTMIKYSIKEFNLDLSTFTGREISYNKRYNEKSEFIGETFIVTLTRIQN